MALETTWRLSAVMALAGFAVPLLEAAGPRRSESDTHRGNYVDILIRETYTSLADQELTARVAEVGERVLHAAGNPHGYRFRFSVLNDPVPNAMATAGGYVYVTTGLLQILKSEDELAAVIGHEIGHVNNRHPTEVFSKLTKVRLTKIGLQIGTAVAAAYASQAVSGALANQGLSAYDVNRMATGMGNLVSLTLSEVGVHILTNMHAGYAKSKEFEADGLAIEYSGKAGYDRTALGDVLQRLHEMSRSPETRRFVTYLHSNPGRLQDRIRKLAPAN